VQCLCLDPYSDCVIVRAHLEDSTVTLSLCGLTWKTALLCTTSCTTSQLNELLEGIRRWGLSYISAVC